MRSASSGTHGIARTLTSCSRTRAFKPSSARGRGRERRVEQAPRPGSAGFAPLGARASRRSGSAPLGAAGPVQAFAVVWMPGLASGVGTGEDLRASEAASLRSPCRSCPPLEDETVAWSPLCSREDSTLAGRCSAPVPPGEARCAPAPPAFLIDRHVGRCLEARRHRALSRWALSRKLYSLARRLGFFEAPVATVRDGSHSHEEPTQRGFAWARRTADRTPLPAHRAKNVAISELCCTQGHNRASTHLCGPAIIRQLSLRVNREGCS